MELVEKLKSFPWSEYGVEYAILYGSALRGPWRDIDLAVKFARFSLDALSDLLAALAEFLGVREDALDILPLNREDLPAALVMEVYTRGVLLYCSDREAFLSEAFRRVNVSYDFLLDSRKLRLVETAVRAVKRRWQ